MTTAPVTIEQRILEIELTCRQIGFDQYCIESRLQLERLKLLFERGPDQAGRTNGFSSENNSETEDASTGMHSTENSPSIKATPSDMSASTL